MQGFIKIHRKLIDNPIYKNSELLHLFLHCILKANFKDNEFLFNGKLIIIKRGSFITGRKELSKELNLSESKIYRYQHTLKNLKYINIQAFNKYSIIEVIHFAKYQNVNIEVKNKNSEKPNNKNTAETIINKEITEAERAKVNNKRTTNEQQMNTKKNDKKEKKKETYYRNYTVRMFSKITSKELSYSYSIVNKLIKLKTLDTEISFLQKCLMLIYIIRKYRERINDEKYIGILTNQYRELSYSDFKAKLYKPEKQLTIYEPNFAGALN